ncbi:hypothetical protein ERIC2_c08650 [Paenibacillus larvae subsp. larvae DSM 25430]|uniref:Rolling Circle replication initiation protein N-terminal domain-containing protein n=1 Tax=Paenibacillus larvae subsp. larvae DSM 25430 TaxID=697284 RepID=V9W3H2_9BACL|nr:replication initiation factor domain-containing protein [Paenibacillus larvae]AHD04698.1 hypothetical protein ERIC2_c08650 [Paenibacillus larvae subsp. larvae DSM 25430]
MNEIKSVEQVKNTENLAVYIDRCGLVVKKETLKTISEVLGIPYNPLSPGAGFDSVGWRSVVKCLDNEHVYHILMIGEGCREFEKYLLSQGMDWNLFFEKILEYEVKIRRINLAIDDQQKVYNISDLLKRAKRGVFNQKISVDYDGSTDERIITLGSIQSNLLMKFYERYNMNRYEFKFREKQAMKIVQESIKGNDLLSIAKEFLHDVFPE